MFTSKSRRHIQDMSSTSSRQRPRRQCTMYETSQSILKPSRISNRLRDKERNIGLYSEFLCKPLSIHLIRLAPDTLLELNQKLDKVTKKSQSQCETLDTKHQSRDIRSSSIEIRINKVLSNDGNEDADRLNDESSKKTYDEGNNNSLDLCQLHRKRTIEHSDVDDKSTGHEKRLKKEDFESGNSIDDHKSIQKDTRDLKEVRILLTKLKDTDLRSHGLKENSNDSQTPREQIETKSRSVSKNLIPKISLVKLEALENFSDSRHQKNSASEIERLTVQCEGLSPKKGHDEMEKSVDGTRRRYSHEQLNEVLGHSRETLEEDHVVNNIERDLIINESEDNTLLSSSPIQKNLQPNMLKIWRNAFCSDKSADRPLTNPKSDISSNFNNPVTNVKKSIAKVFPRLLSAANAMEASKNTASSASEGSDLSTKTSESKNSSDSNDKELIISSPVDNSSSDGTIESIDAIDRMQCVITDDNETNATKPEEKSPEKGGEEGENEKHSNLNLLPDLTKPVVSIGSNDNCKEASSKEITISVSPSLAISRPKSSLIQQVSPKRNKLRIYKCMICKTSFQGYQALQAHLLESHGPSSTETTKTVPAAKTPADRTVSKSDKSEEVSVSTSSGTTVKDNGEKETERDKTISQDEDKSKKQGEETMEALESPSTPAVEVEEKGNKVSPRVRLICTLCNEVFFDGSTLDEHVEYHRNVRRSRPQYICVDVTAIKRVVICSVCANVYDDIKDFEEHWPNHGSIREDFVCASCEKHMDNLQSFLEHAVQHKIEGDNKNNRLLSCKVTYREVHKDSVHSTESPQEITPTSLISQKPQDSESSKKETWNVTEEQSKSSSDNALSRKSKAKQSLSQSTSTDTEVEVDKDKPKDITSDESVDDIVIIEEIKDRTKDINVDVSKSSNKTSTTKANLETKKRPFLRVKTLAELQGKTRTMTTTTTTTTITTTTTTNTTTVKTLRLYLCSFCGMTFNSMEKLKEHHLTHANDEEPKENSNLTSKTPQLSTTTANTTADGSSSTNTTPSYRSVVNNIVNTLKIIYKENNVQSQGKSVNRNSTSDVSLFNQCVRSPICFPEQIKPGNSQPTIPVHPHFRRYPPTLYIPPACKVGTPIAASSGSQYNYSQSNRPPFMTSKQSEIYGKRMSEFLPVLPAPTPPSGRPAEAVPKNAFVRPTRATTNLNYPKKYTCTICPGFHCNTVPEFVRHKSSVQHEINQGQVKLQGTNVSENVGSNYIYPWKTGFNSPSTSAPSASTSTPTEVSAITFSYQNTILGNGSSVTQACNRDQTTMNPTTTAQPTQLYNLLLLPQGSQQPQHSQEQSSSGTKDNIFYVCDYCPNRIHFLTEDMMRYHMDSEHNYLCNICGQRLFTSNDLEVHKIKHEIMWEASAFQGNGGSV